MRARTHTHTQTHVQPHMHALATPCMRNPVSLSCSCTLPSATSGPIGCPLFISGFVCQDVEKIERTLRSLLHRRPLRLLPIQLLRFAGELKELLLPCLILLRQSQLSRMF